MRNANVRHAVACVALCKCKRSHSNLLAASLTGTVEGGGMIDREVVLSLVTSAGVAVVDEEGEEEAGGEPR